MVQFREKILLKARAFFKREIRGGAFSIKARGFAKGL